MRGELGKLPCLAVPACAGFGGVRQGGRGSQILADGDQLRETRVGRVGGAPGSVKEPRDSDEVSDGLGRERTRHASKEQPLRPGVKPALTLLVRTRPQGTPNGASLEPGAAGARDLEPNALYPALLGEARDELLLVRRMAGRARLQRFR